MIYYGEFIDHVIVSGDYQHMLVSAPPKPIQHVISTFQTFALRTRTSLAVRERIPSRVWSQGSGKQSIEEL
jgi:hypothetical protein